MPRAAALHQGRPAGGWHPAGLPLVLKATAPHSHTSTPEPTVAVQKLDPTAGWSGTWAAGWAAP